MTQELTLTSPLDGPLTVEEWIRERAFALSGARTNGGGSPLEDWLQAERELLGDPSSYLPSR